MAQRSIHIVVSGKVQGVGYRWFVVQKATEFNIVGWIRNMSNSDVEIVAHGAKSDIDTFIDWVKTGSTRARVITTTIDDFNSENHPDSFAVR